jgi:predicted permease
MLDLFILVFPVFGLVAVGYAAALVGAVSSDTTKGLSEFLFTFAAPALIFKLICAATFPETIPWGYWIAYYSGMGIAWGASMLVVSKVFGATRGEAVIAGLATGQANTVMIGIPIILKAYGDQAAFPIALLLAVNLPITMTVATLMLEGSRAAGSGAVIARLVRGLLTHPILLGIIFGLAAVHWDLRPTGAIATMVDMLAACAIPGGLVALGLALKTYGVRKDLPVAFTVSGFRLLIHPAITYVVAAHIFALPPAWTGAVVLFAAMPAGINAYLFAARYGEGIGIASTAVALTTVLSVVTSMLWLRILGVG